VPAVSSAPGRGAWSRSGQGQDGRPPRSRRTRTGAQGDRAAGMKEVTSEHGGGLRAQEPPPGRSAALRGGRYPRPPRYPESPHDGDACQVAHLAGAPVSTDRKHAYGRSSCTAGSSASYMPDTSGDRSHTDHPGLQRYRGHVCVRQSRADRRISRDAVDQPKSLNVIGMLARRVPDRRFRAAGHGRRAVSERTHF